MDIDSLDIYDDLDEFQENEEKKSAELVALETKYKESVEIIEKMKLEEKAMRKQLRTMEMNFQILLDTARTEIKRKDVKIADLQREKDEICFRRNNAVTSADQRVYQHRYGKNPFKWSTSTVSKDTEITEDFPVLPEQATQRYKDRHSTRVPKQNETRLEYNSIGVDDLNETPSTATAAVEKPRSLERSEKLIICHKRQRSSVDGNGDDDIGKTKQRKIYYTVQNSEESSPKTKARFEDNWLQSEEKFRRRDISYEEGSNHHYDGLRRNSAIDHESEENRSRAKSSESHKDHKNFRSNRYISDYDKHGWKNDVEESSAYYRHSHSRRETERYHYRYEKSRERFPNSRHDKRKDYISRDEHQRHEELLVHAKVQDFEHYKRNEMEREDAKVLHNAFERSSVNSHAKLKSMMVDNPGKDEVIKKKSQVLLEVKTKKHESGLEETGKSTIKSIAILKTPSHKATTISPSSSNISAVTLSSDSNKSMNIEANNIHSEKGSTENTVTPGMEAKGSPEISTKCSPSCQKSENRSVSMKVLQKLNANTDSPSTSPGAFSEITEVDKYKDALSTSPAAFSDITDESKNLSTSPDAFSDVNEVDKYKDASEIHKKNQQQKKNERKGQKEASARSKAEVESYFVRIETQDVDKDKRYFENNVLTNVNIIPGLDIGVEKKAAVSRGNFADSVEDDNIIIEINDDTTPVNTDDDDDDIVFENIESATIQAQTTTEATITRVCEEPRHKAKKHIEIIEDIRLPPVLPIKQTRTENVEIVKSDKQNSNATEEMKVVPKVTQEMHQVESIEKNNILKDSQSLSVIPVEEKGLELEEGELEEEELNINNKLRDLKAMVEKELMEQTTAAWIDHNSIHENKEIKDSVLNFAEQNLLNENRSPPDNVITSAHGELVECIFQDTIKKDQSIRLSPTNVNDTASASNILENCQLFVHDNDKSIDNETNKKEKNRNLMTPATEISTKFNPFSATNGKERKETTPFELTEFLQNVNEQQKKNLEENTGNVVSSTKHSSDKNKLDLLSLEQESVMKTLMEYDLPKQEETRSDCSKRHKNAEGIIILEKSINNESTNEKRHVCTSIEEKMKQKRNKFDAGNDGNMFGSSKTERKETSSEINSLPTKDESINNIIISNNFNDNLETHTSKDDFNLSKPNDQIKSSENDAVDKQDVNKTDSSTERIRKRSQEIVYDKGDEILPHQHKADISKERALPVELVGTTENKKTKDKKSKSQTKKEGINVGNGKRAKDSHYSNKAENKQHSELLEETKLERENDKKVTKLEPANKDQKPHSVDESFKDLLQNEENAAGGDLYTFSQDEVLPFTDLDNFRQYVTAEDSDNAERKQASSNLEEKNSAESLKATDSKNFQEERKLLSNSNNNRMEEGNISGSSRDLEQIKEAQPLSALPEENENQNKAGALQVANSGPKDNIWVSECQQQFALSPEEHKSKGNEEITLHDNEEMKNVTNKQMFDDGAKDQKVRGILKSPKEAVTNELKTTKRKSEKISARNNNESSEKRGRPKRSYTKKKKEQTDTTLCAKEVLQVSDAERSETPAGEKKPRKKRKSPSVSEAVVNETTNITAKCMRKVHFEEDDGNGHEAKMNLEDDPANEVADDYDKANVSVRPKSSSRGRKLKPVTIKFDSNPKRRKTNGRTSLRILDSSTSNDEMAALNDSSTSQAMENSTDMETNQSREAAASPFKPAADLTSHQPKNNSNEAAPQYIIEDDVKCTALMVPPPSPPSPPPPPPPPSPPPPPLPSQEQQQIKPTTAIKTSTQVIAPPTPDHQIFHCESSCVNSNLVLPVFNAPQQDKQYRDIDSRLQSMFQSPPHVEPHPPQAIQNLDFSPAQSPSKLSASDTSAFVIGVSPGSNFTNNNASSPSSSIIDASLSNLSPSLAGQSSLSATPTTLNHSSNSAHNNSLETKCVSLGNSQYRIEKVSENLCKVFITRRRHRKK